MFLYFAGPDDQVRVILGRVCVFTSKDKRAAATAKRLAEHYGAETIVYKVEKVEHI